MGKRNPFNKLLQPLYNWLISQDITLQVTWVPSEKCLADPISRWEQDKEDYTLDHNLFRDLQKFFKKYINLETDLFASPGNKQLNKFVSRWPHWQASGVDALKCPLDNLGGVICKPPLVNHLKISPKIKTVPKCPSFNGAPLLGFSHMVAPINKNESAKHSLPKDHP